MAINFTQRELYHHGILGQKWGRRQGPPYPLDAGDHSAAEKSAGYKKSLGGGRNESLYDRKDQNKGVLNKAFNKAVSKQSSRNTTSTKMEINPSDSAVTKRVKKDYNELTDQEFMRKYSATKETYKKRVDKYGDPYMNAPLAKLGKKLEENQKAKEAKNVQKLQKRIDKLDADIGSYDSIVGKGVTTKSGKTILTSSDVDDMIDGLNWSKAVTAQRMLKYGSVGKKEANRILNELSKTYDIEIDKVTGTTLKRK